MKARSINWDDLPKNAFIKWLSGYPEEGNIFFDELKKSDIEKSLLASLNKIEKELNEDQFKGIREVYKKYISLDYEKTYLSGLFTHILMESSEEDRVKLYDIIKTYKANVIIEDD